MSSIATCVKNHCPAPRRDAFAEKLKGFQDAHLADKIDAKEAKIQAVTDAIEELKTKRKEVMDQVRAKFPRAKFEQAIADEPPPVSENATVQDSRTGSESEQEDKFANNKVFTADKVAAARARLKAKRGSLSSGFDPELMQDMLVIGGAHFEAGIRKFSAWSKAVMDDIGEEFKPFLRGTYENLRHYPGIEKDGMSTAGEVEEYLSGEKADSFKSLYEGNDFQGAAKMLVESAGIDEINGKLDDIFGTVEEAEAAEDGKGEHKAIYDIAIDYRADIKYAARTRYTEEVARLLEEVRAEERELSGDNGQAGRNGDVQPAAKVRKRRKAKEKQPGANGGSELISEQDEQVEQAEHSPGPNATPAWAEKHAKEIGGRVIYHDDEVALIEGFTMTGKLVYSGLLRKQDARTRVGIDAYTGSMFSAEQKQRLVAAAEQAGKLEEQLHAANPDGPFAGNGKFASSENTPLWAAEFTENLLKMLGVDARVYLATLDDAKSATSFHGPFAAIRSAAVIAPGTFAEMRQMSNGDMYIVFRPTTRKTLLLETLAHEVGHVVEKTAWKNATEEERSAVLDEFKKWRDRKGLPAREWVNSMRALRLAKNTNVPAGVVSDNMTPYWKSFSEYFADQVSRWAVSDDKPLSVVDRFFKKIAASLRKIYASLAGERFLPSAAMRAYLSKRSSAFIPLRDGGAGSDIVAGSKPGEVGGEGSESLGNREGFTYSVDDIPLSLAHSAHASSSFSPEKRAVQEREGYLQHMGSVIDSLLKHANTDEKKDALKAWFNGYYRTKYVEMQKALLSANSRTMSSMITGPANFPVRSNQKKLDTANKRMTELLEWDKKAVSKMRNELVGSTAISSTDKDAKGKLEAKLEMLEKAQQVMRDANKIVRNKKLSDAEKIEQLVSLGITEKNAPELLQPDFAGRIGFASYALTNNNAEINRIKGRIAEQEQRSAKAEEVGGSVETPFDGGRVEQNYEDGYLRIYHDDKPSAEVRAQLKANGFRWAPSEGAWRRKLNNSAKWKAEEITGVKLSKSQPSAVPGATTPADIRAEVSAKLGKFRTMQLMRRGVLNVVATQGEAEADIQNKEDAFRSEQTGAIQGYVKNGKVTLVADGIQSGNAYQVFLHEITHATRLGLNSNAKVQRLLDTIESHKGQDTALGKAISSAEARIPADTKPEHRTEEILAYLIENDRADVGVVRRFIAMVKRVLVNMGVSPDIFSAADFKALAVNAAKWQSTMAAGGNVMRSVREMFKPVDVDSENFKRWFNGSKVVDANGEPLVVYHGTLQSGFNKFDMQGDGKSLTWVTESPGYASVYAGDQSSVDEERVVTSYSKPAIYKAYVSINNPIDLTGLGDLERVVSVKEGARLLFGIRDVADFYKNSENIKSKLVEFKKEGGGLVDESLLRKMLKIYRDQGKGAVVPLYEMARFGRQRWKSQGYDGVVALEQGNKVFGVFSPTQIKSAISNTGAFSPTDPRIQYSVASRGTGITGNGSGPAWATPQDSKTDSFIYNAQDKLIDMKRIQDNIEKALGPIQEQHDVRMAEELYHKRAAKRVEDVLVAEVNPLMKELGAIPSADLSEFEEYMHALHAPEANESLRQRNPNEQELRALKEAAKADRDNLQQSAIVRRFIDKERELAAAERDVEAGDADDSLIAVINDELESLRDEPIVGKYIKAREKHRKLRHAQPFGGDNTALSGMSNESAESLLANMPAAKLRKYKALAAKWRRFMDKTRDTLVQYELESQETVDSWAEAFENYVPLHREDMENGMGIGQGFSVKGSATRSRTGSNRKVVDIIAHIVAQRERAIVRGEKAAISRALYGLAAANPNPDVWTIETPPVVREFDPVTGLVVSRPDPMYKNKPNAVVHRFIDEKGHVEERAVLFNEQSERGMRLAQALKNLDTEQLGAILRTSAVLTRWFSAINTQYNLVFGPVNAIRDAGSAMLHLTDTPLAGRQAQVAKRIATGIKPLFKAIWAEASGTPLDTDIAKAWHELQIEGGTTGFRDMFENAEERAEELKRAMLSTTKSRIAAKLSWAKQQVSQYNDVMENCTRLAVYMESRDQGLSKAKSASLAKNITLNFNRKGKVASQAGAMYAFFNASMQGTEKMYRTMTGPAGKKILAGGLLLGASQAVMLAAAGFSDDEPPEFIKERALIIPVGGKKYVTIPMPLGFNIIPNVARVATEWMLSGGKDTGERVTGLIGSFAETFNPIGNAGFSVQTIAPTVIDPLVALSENKDWTGKPIAKQNFNTLKPTPGHERMKDTASAVGIGLSRLLNFLSGGTEYTPGSLSPTPDQIDYLIGQAFGGVGRESLKAVQVVGTMYTGEDLPVYKIPLVSRFYGDSADSSAASTAFYRNVKRMNVHAAEIEGLAENRGDVAGYMADHPEAKYVRRTEATYRRVQKLQKVKRTLLKNDAPRAKVEAVEKSISSLMSSYNNYVEAGSYP